MESSENWVAAAPFRAHVGHLMSATGLTWPVIAAATGVPAGVVRTLVLGRNGHPRPHLRRRDAERLMWLTATEATRAERRLVNPIEARRLVRALREAGMHPDDVADRVGMGLGEMDQLLGQHPFGVREVALWRLRALVREVGLDLDDIRIAA